jgi:hypothetical protein
MKPRQIRISGALTLVAAITLLAGVSWAHVTFRPNQSFPAGGSADITMMVPTERAVGTVSVSLEVDISDRQKADARQEHSSKTHVRSSQARYAESQILSAENLASLFDVHLQQISNRTEIAAHQRTIQRLAGYVVPQRLRFRILHHEKPVVKARVTEVVQLAIDVRDQTGPCFARRSKCRHPVLTTGAPLCQVMKKHLLGEQGEIAGGRMCYKHCSVLSHPAIPQDFPQWLCPLNGKRLEDAAIGCETPDVESGFCRTIRELRRCLALCKRHCRSNPQRCDGQQHAERFQGSPGVMSYWHDLLLSDPLRSSCFIGY